MDKFLTNLFSRYGISLLIGAFVAVMLIWFIVHRMSAPGEQVSVVWGLVEYNTKPTERMETRNTLIPFTENKQIEATELSRGPVAVEISDDANEDPELILSELRGKHSLRLLTALESGKMINETPTGTYFYTLYAWFDNNEDYFQERVQGLKVSRYPTRSYNLEIHHSGDGEFYVVGFVSKTDAANVSRLTGTEKKNVILSATSSSGFPSMVRLPVLRILSSSDRNINLSKKESLCVLDIVLQ